MSYEFSLEFESQHFVKVQNFVKVIGLWNLKNWNLIYPIDLNHFWKSAPTKGIGLVCP